MNKLTYFLRVVQGQKRSTQFLSLQEKFTYYLREEKCQKRSVQVTTYMGYVTYPLRAEEGQVTVSANSLQLWAKFAHFLRDKSGVIVSTKFCIHWAISRTNIGFGRLTSIWITPFGGLGNDLKCE